MVFHSFFSTKPLSFSTYSVPTAILTCTSCLIVPTFIASRLLLLWKHRIFMTKSAYCVCAHFALYTYCSIIDLHHMLNDRSSVGNGSLLRSYVLDRSDTRTTMASMRCGQLTCTTFPRSSFASSAVSDDCPSGVSSTTTILSFLLAKLKIFTRNSFNSPWI